MITTKMTNKIMKANNGKLPSSFRIFGYGKDVESVIESLKDTLPAGVEAVMMNEGEIPSRRIMTRWRLF